MTTNEPTMDDHKNRTDDPTDDLAYPEQRADERYAERTGNPLLPSRNPTMNQLAEWLGIDTNVLVFAWAVGRVERGSRDEWREDMVAELRDRADELEAGGE